MVFTGEMEITYMNRICRASNFQALLRDPSLRDSAADFVSAYEVLLDEDRRGTRLKELFSHRVDSSGQIIGVRDPEKRKLATLHDQHYSALLTALNSIEGEQRYSDCRQNVHIPGSIFLHNKAYLHKGVSLRGVSYRSVDHSTKDCNIIFTKPDEDWWRAGVIVKVFTHPRIAEENGSCKNIEELFLVIEQFLPLSDPDSQRDPYRQFPRIGGRLFYQKRDPTLLVLRSAEIDCHFALTPLDGDEFGIVDGVIHALPLDRVSTFSQLGDPAAN